MSNAGDVTIVGHEHTPKRIDYVKCASLTLFLRYHSAYSFDQPSSASPILPFLPSRSCAVCFCPPFFVHFFIPPASLSHYHSQCVCVCAPVFVLFQPFLPVFFFF